MNYITEDWEVLNFHNSISIDPRELELSNIDLRHREDKIFNSLVYEMRCKILALPKERIVFNEIIYDNWFDQLLSQYTWLQKLFGKPKFREISIDKQLYGSIITNRQVDDVHSFHKLPTVVPKQCT